MTRIHLETERLLLRNLTAEDYEAAFRWCGDPAVNRFMIYPLYTNSLDVRRWLEMLDPEDPNVYDCGIVLRSTGELIGSAGMYDRERTGVWSIGYNLRRDQWGKGLTTEAMRALIEHVRSERVVKAIEAEHAVENRASGRVMEKLGMRFVRDGQYSKSDGSVTFPSRIMRFEFPK